MSHREHSFDVPSAQKFARQGKLEEWVHSYLAGGEWANPGLSDGLMRQNRWWNGPLELPLSELSRAVGPESGMEYPVDAEQWMALISSMAETMNDLLAIPPLIVEYRDGVLSVRDGNTRHGAMSLRGWSSCWTLIWYNSQADYEAHCAQLGIGSNVKSEAIRRSP